jgi:hypothetical protein
VSPHLGEFRQIHPIAWAIRAKSGMLLPRQGSIMRIIGIDHIQLAMPPGQEDAARAF